MSQQQKEKEDEKEQANNLLVKNVFIGKNGTNYKSINVEKMRRENELENCIELIKREDEDTKEVENKKYQIQNNTTCYVKEIKDNEENDNRDNLYETISQTKSKSLKKQNINGSELVERYNHIEHYNIMSSTETVVSSNETIEDMYETNYYYFTQSNATRNGTSIVSSDSQKIFDSNLIIHKNDINLNCKDIKIISKSHEKNVLLNSKQGAQQNKLNDDVSRCKCKCNTLMFMSNNAYTKDSKNMVPKHKNVMNFNPLVYITNSKTHHPNITNNCNDAFCSYNNTSHSYDNISNDYNTGLHYNPICVSPNRYINCLNIVNKTKSELYYIKKYTPEYGHYGRTAYLTNKLYLKGKFKKKSHNNNFFPFKRYNQINYKNRKFSPNSFLFKKLRHHNKIDHIDSYTKIENRKYRNFLNNLIMFRPRKNRTYERKNSICKSKSSRKKSLFINLLKKLKLVGYALFFCFFMSNQNKSTKEKQNSNHFGNTSYTNSSSFKNCKKKNYCSKE
ncbi:conserved Plasmodium protein, unknown function [Plasmodium malariae]|uniref:Uncharacterized protein n=1 Tax=Plasmodium malariae TaxID=5858 RepID=A0A1C3KEI8_PLAMA|nr:conserved Plasmodium protein, unknown function [Plasmodium malariae]